MPPTDPELSSVPTRVKMPDRKIIMTYVLVGVTVFFFALQYLVQSVTGVDLLFVYGGKINAAIIEGQVWRLITPALLHSSILHVALNMYALYIIGRRLEVFYGPWKLLLLYTLSAFAGNVLSFVLTPSPSLGASTAIFGLFAAEGVFIYQNRKLFGQIRTRQMISNLVVVLMINLVYGFMGSRNIDNMGHIGGLLGGIFFAWQGGPVLQIAGQAPFLEIVDNRKRRETVIAAVVVIIGFTIIALIPFFTR